MRKSQLPLVILFLFLFSNISYTQTTPEIGFPQIKNFGPKDYNAELQNWAIDQDKNGVMYFGNNMGLLEYDGVNWELYKLPNNSVLRSISIAKDGRIFVGAVGELGYFLPDQYGVLQYHSLIQYLKPEERNFSNVWNTHILNNEVIFQTTNYIFKWSLQNKLFKTIKGVNTFHLSRIVDNSYYVREWGVGLLKMEGDSLKLVPGSERFANERIYAILPFPGEKNVILIGTRTQGLFKFDGNKFEQFRTQADDFINKNLLYSNTVLKDDNLLFGTMLGGSIIIDKNGNLVQILNKAAGLSSDAAYFQFQDKNGGVWIATDYGISRMDCGSPITYFDKRKGLPNNITSLIRFKGSLYASSVSGSYYFDTSSSQFISISNLGIQGFNLLEAHGQLLAATTDGIAQIEKDKAYPIRKNISNEYNTQFFSLSNADPTRLYISTAEGLGVMNYKNRKWSDKVKIVNIADFTTSIAEEKDGTIWTGSAALGVYRVSYRHNKNGIPDFDKPLIKRFGEEHGIPTSFIYPKIIDGTTYFVAPKNIYRFNEKTESFFVDSTFMVVPLSGFMPSLIAKDSNGHLWISMGKQPALGTLQGDGKYKWLTAPFKRFSEDNLICIYPESSTTVWFGTGSGLIKYELNKKSIYDKSFSVLIRKASYGKDNKIYYSGYDSHTNPPKVLYRDNSARFVFAATCYDEEEKNQYSTFLDGFDDGWSNWSRENIREYTNLPPGRYRFRVIAKNLEDLTSNEASFNFIVLPPWYRTWWAYSGYILILIGLFIAFERIYRRRVIQKERELSHIREMELRAEIAEAENERKKNVELLSEIGRDITSNLSIEQIIDTVYQNVNSLMDASVFGIGLYDENNHRLVFPATKEKGIRLAPFYADINDENRLGVWCFKNQKDVLINDYQEESIKYIKELKSGDNPEAILYLPLNYKDKHIGVITAQSFKKNSYTDYHLNILRNLATYTAIAMDNADAYTQLNETIDKLNLTLADLKATQEQLIVQQKLASLGQLTAGIAHEIKNPLNFVNNFAQLSKELIQELKDDFSKLKDNIEKKDAENIEALLSDIEQNVIKINEHGGRADGIVNSMLLHSRGKSGEKQKVNLNDLLNESLNLAYHGYRSQDSTFNCKMEKNYDSTLEPINVVPQNISRVFLNIFNNGFYSINEKNKEKIESYNPLVRISTQNLGDEIEIKIWDNGNGIPKEILDKIFNPFFTTKSAGKGTGLGLSLSYDIIVQEHQGELKVNTQRGEFAEFVITLPKYL